MAIQTLGDLFVAEAAARAKADTDEAEQRRARLESDMSWLIGFYRGDLDAAELTGDVMTQLDAILHGTTPPSTSKTNDEEVKEDEQR